MAPTLAFLQSSPTPPSLPTAVPPPSQDFVMQQMPNVFVHPPDEELEYNPPWCYFDATQAVKDNLTTHPDIEALDVALSFCQQTDNRAPAFRRTFPNESQDTVVMPRRGSLLNLKFRAPDLEMDMELEPDGQPDIRSRGPRRYDDDVVEVVKFRRGESVADLGPEQTVKAKKTNTFRARATQALRSIKNVGKGNRDRRTTVSAPQPLSPAESQSQMDDQSRHLLHGATLPTRHSFQDSPISRPASPSISRRRSLTISQLFTSFKDNKENQSSRPASPADELIPPTSPTLVDSDSMPSVRPMSPADSPIPRRFLPSDLQDYTPPTPKSPTPTPRPPAPEPTSKVERRRSFVRRLSVLELQKLFTGGHSSSSAYSSESTPLPEDDDVFSPSPSQVASVDSVGILSASSSRISQGSRYSNTSSDVLSARPSWSSQLSGRGTEEGEAADLELRLDSLHFDSLHFDPDEIMSSL
uniref:Type II secretion system protein D n=1 Tax=Ganoderma boninense TaxID=34458 RepID=A0A5K1K255_9APHY|nr:Type II secretion system protein D [Ganoderma boninense]